MPPKFLARLTKALSKKKASPIPDRGTPFGIGSLVDGRYRLEAELGRGGMGIVYRAHDLPNDREVALKIINLDKANVLSLQQFSREAQVMSGLANPNIVAVYETGTVDTGKHALCPYIVMELVQGVGLDEIHGFTYARIIDLGKQICEALAYAHSQGFVHRDLKPANVLIEKCGFHYCAKLMDFGLARPRDMANLPTESNTAGTIFYLAPEVIAGHPADVSSDLYALGVILYEMITGRVPFSDFIDDASIFSQHLEEAVTPPSHSRDDLPPPLEAIVLRLLEKNPKDRFTSSAEVKRALNEIVLSPDSGEVRGNLPEISPKISGYEADIAQVKGLLESNNLVTILDGDMTLAVASGTQLAGYFPDGVWLVDLEPVSDPASVLTTVASVFGVCANDRRAPAVCLVEFLREKHLLLLLSNCEHVNSACTQLAETILRACPEVRILVTSREALNVPGEKCLRAFH